jgi:hypothetical protein
VLPDDDPFPHVPMVKPADWYDFRAFRETFLCDVWDKKDMEAFRAFGGLQQRLLGEVGFFWPFTYMDATAHYLRAALADLRYLQGFLVEHSRRSEDDKDGDREQYDEAEEAVKRHDALCELGNRVAQQLGALAAELEKEVGGWQFKKRPPGT